MWRLNQKGQGGVVGAMIGLVIATVMLYITLVILDPFNALLGNAFSGLANGATLIVIWGLIPLILVFGIIISVWMQMTSSRQQPPQY